MIRNGVGRTTPVPIKLSGISISSISEIIGTSAAPPSGNLCIPKIVNIRQSTPQMFREPDELNAGFDRIFFNDPIATSVSAHVFGEKLSSGSNRDLHMCCRVNIATESVNLVEPIFMNHVLSAIIAIKAPRSEFPIS